MSTTRGTEEINREGATEIKVDTVETVDYRSPPGQEDKEPNKEDIHVVHLTRKGADSRGGIAGAVASTLESAKNAISGGNRDKKTDE